MIADYVIAVFWSEADRAWIADAPDLKTCSAHGATPKEAVKELRIATTAWLESSATNGLPLPEPRFKAALPTAE